MLLLSIASTILAYGSVVSKPYVCSYCGESFYTESALLNHIKTSHDIDISILGEMKDNPLTVIEHREYTPVAYYTCHTSGLSFYTEAALCHHMGQ